MQSTADRYVISVSELNSQAKEVLELLNFWVEGEVSGFKPMDSQRYFYVYFTLQDSKGKASMSCAMRRDEYVRLGSELENGQNILVKGKMSLMTQSGRAVFLVHNFEIAGQGKLAAEIEKLKLALQAEGLLAEERKRPLPSLPMRIGVVTSVHSDAWEDFKRHSIAKFPCIELVVADSFVQGPKASASLVTAIESMQQQPIDILVVTRGGGSVEDLAAFSDEKVVRAIAGSKIPTVVGVGHEKDVSVADLVADVRASTPTNAGQIVTSSYEEAAGSLGRIYGQLPVLGQRIYEQYFERVDEFGMRLHRTHTKFQSLPHQLSQFSAQLHQFRHQLISGNQSHLAVLHYKLVNTSRLHVERSKAELDGLNRQLQAVSPINVLARGYSITRVGGKIVTSPSQVKTDDVLEITLAHGKVQGKVIQEQDDISNSK